jgi:hypothetical protein
MLLISLGLACAQTTSTVEPAGRVSTSVAAPEQAGESSATSVSTSLTGIDDSALGSIAEGRWYFQPQVYGSQEVGINVQGQASVSSITRAIAGLLLDRKWRHYGLGVAYLGAGSVTAAASSVDGAQAQAAVVEQAINWNSGQLQVVDVFGYLPDSGFGAVPFGGWTLFGLGMGSNLTLLASTRFVLLNPSQFASFGNTPRLSNVAIVEADQSVTGRSSVTALASYGVLHFFGNGLLNDQQATGALGYNYLLSSRSAMAFVVAYQNLGIGGVSSAVKTEFATVIYARRISRSLYVIGGAGPLWSEFNQMSFTQGHRLSALGYASVTYQLRRTGLSLNFLSYENAGSGFLLGARTNRITASAFHQFTPRWTGVLTLGYSQNRALEAAATPTVGLPVRRSFDSSYVNVTISRQLTTHLSAFGIYGLTNEKFDTTSCSPTLCGLATRQEIGAGLRWSPTAMTIH